MGNSEEHSTALRRNNQQFIQEIRRKGTKKNEKAKIFIEVVGYRKSGYSICAVFKEARQVFVNIHCIITVRQKCPVSAKLGKSIVIR